MGLMGKRRGRASHDSHELIQAILVTIVRESVNLGGRGVGEIILTLRVLISYIYGVHILDVSRSHTTTHHSR
jgi:hypothetical protein